MSHGVDRTDAAPDVERHALARLSEDRSIVPFPATPDGWVCRTLTLVHEDELLLRLEATTGGDLLEVRVWKTGQSDQRAFLRLRHCAVRYGGRLQQENTDHRGMIYELVTGLGAMVDARLDVDPSATIAVALGRKRGARQRLLFSVETLRDLLEPELAIGRPVAGGWVLTDIYPGSGYSGGSGANVALVLDFRREDGQRIAVVVGPRDDTRAAFAQTPNLRVAHVTLGRQPPPGATTVCALVAFVLQLRDHDGLDLVFSDTASHAPHALLTQAPDDAPSDVEDPGVLNLSIERDCGQSCVFCSVRDVQPSTDDAGTDIWRLRGELEQAIGRGIRTVRFNGYDPLAYSRIIELMEHATRLGFGMAKVYSPCTLLADEAFCDAVIEALPDRLAFQVPLYGATAEVHDRCTGLPGSFERVQRAVANLLQRLDRTGVSFTTVVTRDNVQHLGEIAAFAESHGLFLELHLPFPSSESPSDRYTESAPRHSEVAQALAETLHGTGRRIWVRGVAPCVAFEQFSRLGISPKSYLGYPEQKQHLPGTENRDNDKVHRAEYGDESSFEAATIPCPHTAVCGLRTICSGEILRAYVVRHGMDELHPVSISELLGNGPAPLGDVS